ncbi:MAG: extracellular solute-binding protein [Xanthomonadales bacterium]|nr:extracellular solute-binding protein [Xanthomonadales bacterium]NIN58571.1 extracellular solute-binding protein [Xanthomonadales bacterium]NIN73860.1 extracellular solute-binding protein [Xanthomonadales bacterium]NIO12329.1 extracellular solute-binding protein [Xanthomonadales bacterium]NIP10964.1 extracellular solute-binding protein [Xanthomonadales bacterium]
MPAARWLRTAALGALLAWPLPMLAAPDAEEPVLNFYNWADYIGASTLAEFEAEYGIRVNYDTYDSTAMAEAKLVTGRTGYDVVLQAIRYSARLIAVGAFQPLDRDRLSLWDNLDPWVLGFMAEFDPGNTYGAPYMWGTTGFVYNVDLVRSRWPEAPVDSARMLFDPEVAARFADCGITLLDEPTTVIPMVMVYLGHDPNSMDGEHLAAAEAVLKSVRPYVRYFSSAKLLNDLPSGEVCIAMAWSGDFAQAQGRAQQGGTGVQLAYSVPVEGTVLWFDSLLIPSDAPHPGNAHLFLNFLMRPRVIADISNLIGYANANRASLPWLEPRIANDPASYPPLGQRTGWQAGRIFGPKQERTRSRAWSRIKTGL